MGIVDLEAGSYGHSLLGKILRENENLIMIKNITGENLFNKEIDHPLD
jgi:hypothetical protein